MPALSHARASRFDESAPRKSLSQASQSRLSTPLSQGGGAQRRGIWKHVAGPAISRSGIVGRFGHGPKRAMAPPADLGARVSRDRCCLPALAEFST